MTWKRIQSITWAENTNGNEFTIRIKYNGNGPLGAACRLWLRTWIPVLTQICGNFLTGAIGKEKTVALAKTIRKTTTELKSK